MSSSRCFHSKSGATEYRGPAVVSLIELAERTIKLVRPADPDLLLDDPLVIDWNRHDDYMPYWAYLWPAAYLLAEAVAREPWPEMPGRVGRCRGAGDRLRTGSGRPGRRGARPARPVHRL